MATSRGYTPPPKGSNTLNFFDILDPLINWNGYLFDDRFADTPIISELNIWVNFECESLSHC